jgi:hypothetical protein
MSCCLRVPRLSEPGGLGGGLARVGGTCADGGEAAWKWRDARAGGFRRAGGERPVADAPGSWDGGGEVPEEADVDRHGPQGALAGAAGLGGGGAVGGRVAGVGPAVVVEYVPDGLEGGGGAVGGLEAGAAEEGVLEGVQAGGDLGAGHPGREGGDGDAEVAGDGPEGGVGVGEGQEARVGGPVVGQEDGGARGVLLDVEHGPSLPGHVRVPTLNVRILVGLSREMLEMVQVAGGHGVAHRGGGRLVPPGGRQGGSQGIQGRGEGIYARRSYHRGGGSAPRAPA